MPQQGQGDFTRNLRFALARQSEAKRSSISEALKVDQATVYRWLNGLSKPNSYSKAKIATYLNIDAAELDLPHEQFVLSYPQPAPTWANASSKRALRLNVIKRSRHEITDYYDNLKGAYIARYRSISIVGLHFPKEALASDKTVVDFHTNRYTDALLNITGKDPESLHFSMHEVVNVGRQRIVAQYEGLLYPVYDYIYFVGEDTRTHGIINIATQMVHPPALLTGFFLVGAGRGDGLCRAGPIELISLANQPVQLESIASKIGTFPLSTAVEPPLAGDYAGMTEDTTLPPKYES